MIENTTSTDSKAALLAEALLTDGTPGATGALIEAQEAAGQRQLLASDRLPTDLGQRADYEALGFVLGDPDPADPLFMPATLPAGWTREAADHSMWSYITDEHGRRRVATFYKAAFYDRRANARLQTPYAYVRDCIATGTPLRLDDTWATDQAAREALAELAARAEDAITMWSTRGDTCADLLADARAERDRIRTAADALPADPPA